MDEEQLASKAIKGNKQALGKLFSIYQEQLFKTAYMYVRNRDDALDVVQETAYKVTKNIHQVQQPAFMKTWITRTLIRTAYEVLERGKNIVPIDTIFNEEEVASGEENNVKQMDLMRAMEQLEKHNLTVILLYYFHDYKVSDIASITNQPEGTVKTNLFRARQQLRDILGGDYLL